MICRLGFVQYFYHANIRTMDHLYPNDQAHIAEEFYFIDEHVTQTAQLAFLKINSYKLSLINSAFCMSRDELAGIIRNSLLNYTEPADILSETGFYSGGVYN
jgi:hypothetical protein